MSLPLRPAVILRQQPGPARSVDLTVLCANGADCHITAEWGQTTADGITAAVERAVSWLELAFSDHDAAVASLVADSLEPLWIDGAP